MARTVGEFATRAATLPAALVEATPQAVRASGEVLEVAARASVLRATGGDSRLSNAVTIGARKRGASRTRGGGATITLELRVQGAGRRARAVVIPRGPIMLVEGPTPGHRIPRKLLARNYGSRSRVHARVGVYVPGRGFFAGVKHPGTKGKRPVRKAFESHNGPAAEAGLLVFVTETRRHLTGS